MYMRIHVYISIFIYMCICICIYTHMYAYICMYISVCSSVCFCVCAHLFMVDKCRRFEVLLLCVCECLCLCSTRVGGHIMSESVGFPYVGSRSIGEYVDIPHIFMYTHTNIYIQHSQEAIYVATTSRKVVWLAWFWQSWFWWENQDLAVSTRPSKMPIHHTYICIHTHMYRFNIHRRRYMWPQQSSK